MKSLQSVRGMHDILPSDVAAWQWLEENGVRAEISALNWELDVSIEALTQRSQDWIGQQIKGRPAQWLWLHNRGR